jgi:hypothetical protein
MMKRYTAYSLIGVSLILLTLVALTIVNGTRPSGYYDPFKAFDEIAPGQPLSVLAWGVCDSKYYLDDELDRNFFCYVHSDNGPFESIIVTADDTEISVICFRAIGLRVGDLVYRWGRPDSVQHTQKHYTLHWRSGIYATTDASVWYTLESAVDFVAVRKQRAWIISRI